MSPSDHSTVYTFFSLVTMAFYYRSDVFFFNDKFATFRFTYLKVKFKCVCLEEEGSLLHEVLNVTPQLKNDISLRNSA